MLALFAEVIIGIIPTCLTGAKVFVDSSETADSSGCVMVGANGVMAGAFGTNKLCGDGPVIVAGDVEYTLAGTYIAADIVKNVATNKSTCEITKTFSNHFISILIL